MSFSVLQPITLTTGSALQFYEEMAFQVNHVMSLKKILRKQECQQSSLKECGTHDHPWIISESLRADRVQEYFWLT